VQEGGSLELERRWVLDLEWRWASSALCAAIWWERSSMCRRSPLISGIGAKLASVGWGAASMKRSAQWAAACKSPSGWPARMALTLEDSRLGQVLRRKSSGASGARLLMCRSNCDGLRSPISSCVRRWWMRCSLAGVSRLTSSAFSVV
jgi:hypothetical protein